MKVGVVMGSKSDLPVVEKGIEILKEFGVEPVVRIIFSSVKLSKFQIVLYLCAIYFLKLTLPYGFAY